MPAPQYVTRSYGGGADVAQLTAELSATGTTFNISPVTGWTENDGNPLGTVGPFVVVIDRFTPSEEKILCSSINLSSGLVTVYSSLSDGWSGRGYDGTTAIAHVPNGSTSGVQTCWSSVEAMEANAAVVDVLGGGSISLTSVPIGAMLDYTGSPQTIPTNFAWANGQAVARSTYSSLFTNLTITGTGTTTASNPTVTGVSISGITPLTSYLTAGMKVTLQASGGAVYTIASVGTTSFTLTSGTGITAATGESFIIYPHGAGDGSTTFNLPDTRGRGTVGIGAVGTNAQPTTYLGQAIGTQTVSLSIGNLPTGNIGTAAAQTATVADPTHAHSTISVYTNNVASTIGPVAAGGTSSTAGQYQTDTTTAVATGITVTNSTSSVSSAGTGSALNVESPAIPVMKIVRVL